MSDKMREAFDAWRSSKGWQRPDDPGEWEAWQAALSQHPAPVAVPEGLRERCKELIEWQKTGVLVGSALRSYSKAKWYAEEHNSLQMAEAGTAREAYSLIADAPSAAEQPDTVPVPRELLEDVLSWFETKNVAYPPKLRALLGKEAV